MLLLAVVCAVKASAGGPLPDLLTRATKVPGVNMGLPYCWLTDHTLLSVRYVPGRGWQAFTQEAATGRQTLLPKLSARFKMPPGVEPRRLAASPDGRFVFWRTFNGHDGSQDDYCAPLTGASRWTGPAVEDWPISWTPDSRQWVRTILDSSFSKALGFQETSVLPPYRTRRVLFAPSAQRPQDLRTLDAWTLTPANRLVVWAVPNDAGVRTVETDSYAVGTSSLLLQGRQHVALPESASADTNWGGPAICPQNGRAVLRLIFSPHLPDPPGRPGAGEGVESGTPAPDTTIGLWVSSPNGPLRELGHLMTTMDTKDTADVDDMRLQDVTWMPGGKSLSFVFDKALYTLPVD